MKYERIGSHEVHPVASIFPLIDGDELRALADDIRANGLREPIVKLWVPDPVAKGTQKPLILDGRNRLRACELAKVGPEFVKYEGPEDTASLLAFVKSKNLARRHLDESQRALAAAKALALYEEAAKERKVAGAAKARAKRAGSLIPANVPGSEGDARDLAAKDFGVSGRLVQHAKAVAEKGTAEVRHAVERGELKVSAAVELLDLPKTVQKEILEKAKGKPGTVRALKRMHEKRVLGEQLNKKPLPAPTKGPFDVHVWDPPWPYELRNDDASHRGLMPYPPMAIEAICMIPVEELSAPNAVLCLWTTNAFMDEAFDVARAWGFKQKTILTWEKDRPAPGHYLFNITEHCLICTRGNPVVTLGNQTTILRGPVREHSRKPESFYELVEAVFPGKKLEGFSRTPRPGWATWGAEAEKFAGGAR